MIIIYIYIRHEKNKLMFFVKIIVHVALVFLRKKKKQSPLVFQHPRGQVSAVSLRLLGAGTGPRTAAHSVPWPPALASLLIRWVFEWATSVSM